MHKLPVETWLVIPVVVTLALFFLLLIFGKVPLSYNIRNLTVRWRTTLLTALAFTLVIALMTVMLAFVNGLYELTKNSAVAANIVILSDGALDESMSNMGTASGSSPIYFMNQAQRDLLAVDEQGNPLVSLEAYIVVAQPIIIDGKPNGRRRFLQLRGVSDTAMTARIHNLEMQPGSKWLSEAGVQPMERTENGEPTSEQAIQAVIGEGIAREMGKDKYHRPLQIGDYFEARDRKWVVTGILKSAGSTFDSEVWAKMQIVGPFGKDQWTTCIARVKDQEFAADMARDLTATVKEVQVQAQPEVEYYKKLNTTNLQFLYATVFVTIVIGIGGVFGVMNTMFAAIAQRSKDIGVMRILGFARRQILISFFLESLFIALVGGVLGCSVGYLANGLTASSIVSGGGGGKSVVLKLVVDANILTGGILFALFMGAVGGLIPALTAMRLRPLESLR
jgi:putative ABC transport system permease protein